MKTRSDSREVPRQGFIAGNACFDKFVAFKQEVALPRMLEQAQRPGANPKYRGQFIFQIFVERYELLIQKYSRGDDLDELRAMLPDVVSDWVWARREELKVFTPEEMHRRHGFDVNFDAYSLALWMVSIALCLEAEALLLRRIVDLVGNEGVDRLYNRLVATRIPGHRSGATLVYPKPYALLDAVVDEQDGSDRDRQMLRLLKAWYPGMRKAYWHDCHKGKDGGGYFGYWCFEAAGVTRAFGFEDAA